MSIVSIILIIFCGIIFFKFYKKFKKLKLSNVYLVSGGVKTGKSALSVFLAIKYYKRSLRQFYFLSFINVFKFKKFVIEKPMLYSNMPLRNVKYNPLTKDIILRKVRIPYRSIVLIDEASLLADSFLFKDDNINESLMLFVKLFGHYSRGGYCIVNTQSVSDLHFSFKRCINSYLWIHSKKKGLFFTRFNVRELTYMEDSNNSFNEDTEDSSKLFLMPNRIYKQYDCFCYSIFTDSLPVQVDYDSRILTKEDSLKTTDLVSMRKFKTLEVSKDYENFKN